MSANSLNSRQGTAPLMIFITLFAGVTSFVYQFISDGTMLTFMVTVAAIGGLVGTSKHFDEREKQLLWVSYAKAFEVQFLVIFFVYALIVLAGGLHIGAEVIGFMNGHWPSLMASGMCIILGVVGMADFRKVG